jgi:hypothetical protein
VATANTGKLKTNAAAQKAYRQRHKEELKASRQVQIALMRLRSRRGAYRLKMPSIIRHLFQFMKPEEIQEFCRLLDLLRSSDKETWDRISLNCDPGFSLDVGSLASKVQNFVQELSKEINRKKTKIEEDRKSGEWSSVSDRFTIHLQDMLIESIQGQLAKLAKLDLP